MSSYKGPSEEIFSVGAVIADRYEIVKILGSGGMGTVVQVVDYILDGEVGALKFLNRGLTEDKVIFGRFRNEVLIARKLSHPNIVMINDFGSAGRGYYYISMEYASGGILTDKIYARNNKRITFEETLRYLLQICNGLECAHKQGVLHRDLKPDNILLDANGNAKITDFGLSTTIQNNNNFTLTGETVGTPHYMSPEQLAGDVLDNLADIYSLGVLAFEMAAGRRPYVSENYFELARMHMEHEVPNILTINSSLPVWFYEFLKIAMSKYKSERFKSAEEASMFLINQMEQGEFLDEYKIPAFLY